MRYLLLLAALVVGAMVIVPQLLFTVSETEYGVVTRFGQIQTIYSTPGLKSKTPFVDQVQKFDNRILRIDVRVESMPDREQQFLEIDAYVRYRITDPRKFLLRLRDEFTASSRIGNIVVSELRRVVAESDRTDIIGGTTESLPDGTIIVHAKRTEANVESREALTMTVFDGANNAVQSEENDFGVEIVDVRIKRADFPTSVEQSVFNRMRTERDVQAQRLRAEGEELSLSIRADVDRQVVILLAEAERDANRLRGEGEGQAIKIFADGLEQDEEFYAFQRALQAYKLIIDDQTTIVLSAENELFDFLQNPVGNKAAGK